MWIMAILNPTSAAGEALRRRPEIEAALQATGMEFTLAVSEQAGHAMHLAEAAARDGASYILAIGGDGTAHEAANGILSACKGDDCVLAVIPAGTANDLRRPLGIPTDPVEAIRTFTSRQPRAWDVIKVTSLNSGAIRHSINVTSFGMSGDVAHAVNTGRKSKGLLGRFIYLMRVFTVTLKYRVPTMSISIDDAAPRTALVRTMVISNAPWFGGGMHIAPMATTDDGIADIVTIGPISRLQSFVWAPRLLSGNLDGAPYMSRARARSVEATCETYVGIELDGEQCMSLPARFDVIPGALRVV
jgi:YegS/Rv2252/BmrU family lipid kinase